MNNLTTIIFKELLFQILDTPLLSYSHVYLCTSICLNYLVEEEQLFSGASTEAILAIYCTIQEVLDY